MPVGSRQLKEHMERIVVTGIGLVTPNGVGTDTSFQSLINGRSGVGPITQFEATEQYSTRIAAEVKNFDPAAFMEKKKIKEVSRFIPFAIAATRMANPLCLCRPHRRRAA